MRFIVEVNETVTNCRRYLVDADSAEEAADKAKDDDGEEIDEFLGTVEDREVGSVTAVDDKGAEKKIFCRECGEEVQKDPDGSVDVWIHCDTIAEDGRDIDANHGAVPDFDDDETSV